MSQKRYIGVMSGTSMDAVDVALCRIDTSGCTLEYALEYPFDEALKEELLECIAGTTVLQKIGRLDRRLGILFADAVCALLEREGIDAASVEAVGLHGQTLWHEPRGQEPFTMQLGDANIVASRTQITTVADFRRRDVALGGEGAPFAPAFHAFAFGGISRRCAVVNIGGIANITLLEDELKGYDTGPGNMLMDGWINAERGLPYDADGQWARGGDVDDALLRRLMDDPYFSQAAPKSTGRERFSSRWLDTRLEGSKPLPPRDVQATLTELTARTIAEEVRKGDVKLLLVCGGGAKNSFLMERISALLDGVEVASTDAYGVSSTDMEAMAFAWLAYKRLRREPVALSSVTGARTDAILGGVYG